MNGNNCVTQINVSGKVVNANTLTLTIANHETEVNTNFQSIVINKIIVAGIPYYGLYLSKTIDLSATPYTITASNQAIVVKITL